MCLGGAVAIQARAPAKFKKSARRTALKAHENPSFLRARACLGGDAAIWAVSAWDPRHQLPCHINVISRRLCTHRFRLRGTACVRPGGWSARWKLPGPDSLRCCGASHGVDGTAPGVREVGRTAEGWRDRIGSAEPPICGRRGHPWGRESRPHNWPSRPWGSAGPRMGRAGMRGSKAVTPQMVGVPIMKNTPNTNRRHLALHI